MDNKAEIIRLLEDLRTLGNRALDLHTKEIQRPNSKGSVIPALVAKTITLLIQNLNAGPVKATAFVTAIDQLDK